MMVLNSVFSFPPCIPLHISSPCHGNARELRLEKSLFVVVGILAHCLSLQTNMDFAPQDPTPSTTSLFPLDSAVVLDVLAQPPDTLAIALPHDNGDHEDLDGPDALQWDLALAGGLVHAQLVAELILRHSIRVVDLVAENDKGDLCELLHLEQCIQLSLGLGEALVVLGVNQEDNAVDLWEIVPPQSTGYSFFCQSEMFIIV